MKEYSKVLLALELEAESDERLIAKAKAAQAELGATVILVHSVEHLSTYGAAYGVSIGVEMEESMEAEAKKALDKIGPQLNVKPEDRIVAIGSAKQLILEVAAEKKVDLIIVGSHGRSGLKLLLGSTANAVLHNAPCDVLAVRVKD